LLLLSPGGGFSRDCLSARMRTHEISPRIDLSN
jgi:hypothetical protein